MALSFANATGNLFNRLGKLGNLIKAARSYQSTQLTNTVDLTNGVIAQYDAEPDIQALMGSSYIGLVNGGIGGFGGFAQSMAEQTLNRMIFRDNPRISQTLQSLNVEDSIQELIRQMKSAGATVLAQTIAFTPGTFTGVGNGTINASEKRGFDGLVVEHILAENLFFQISSDSYSSSASAGNERVLVTGTGAVGDFEFNWPLGSDASGSLSCIDGSSDTSSGNYLTNSGFDAFTANAPDNWTIAAGAAGVDLFEETSIIFGGTSSLRVLGDGATNVEIRQLFDDATGTPVTLEPLTQYSVCLWMRRDGIAPAAGTLKVELIDSGGTIIQDANGVNNSFTIDCTGLTTSFAPYKGTFRTPYDLINKTYLIRLKFTTPLTAGRSVYLDKLGLGDMVQLYTSGPYLAVHSGSTPFAIGDYAYCGVTNSRGSGGTLNTFQTLMATLFPIMITSEYMLPSSAVPSISDTLIG